MSARVIQRVLHSLTAFWLTCGAEQAIEKVHISIVARRIWEINGVIILCWKTVAWIGRYRFIKETSRDSGPPKFHLGVKCIGLGLGVCRAYKTDDTYDERHERAGFTSRS